MSKTQNDYGFGKLSRINDLHPGTYSDFCTSLGEEIYKAFMEDDNYFDEIGKHLYLLMEQNQNNPEFLKAMNDTVTVITGYCIQTIAERLEKSLDICEEVNNGEKTQDGLDKFSDKSLDKQIEDAANEKQDNDKVPSSFTKEINGR